MTVSLLIATHADYVESVCVFVRSVTETNDPKVFKLGAWNDLGIS